jgi:hypothetical protein
MKKLEQQERLLTILEGGELFLVSIQGKYTLVYPSLCRIQNSLLLL